jgi:hypothetical protein
MKFKFFFLIFFFNGCHNISNTCRNLDGIENYISIEQKAVVLKSIKIFDVILKKKYPEFIGNNLRINQYLKDYINVFYTFESNNITQNRIISILKEFEPNLNELMSSNFFEILLTNDIYDVPNDTNMKEWIESITFKEFRYKVTEDTIFDNSKKRNQIIGRRNKFIYGLHCISKNKSFERELIERYVSYMPSNPISVLSSKENMEKLNNDVIKSLIIYHSIIRIYNVESKKIDIIKRPI